MDKVRPTSPRSNLYEAKSNSNNPQLNKRETELNEENLRKQLHQTSNTLLIQRNQHSNLPTTNPNQTVQSNIQQTSEIQHRPINKNENLINTYNNKYGHSEFNEHKKNSNVSKINHYSNNNDDAYSEDRSNFMPKKPPQPYRTFMKTYPNTGVVEIQELSTNSNPPHSHTIGNSNTGFMRRPYSANTPLTNQNNNEVASNTFHQNTIVYQNQHPPKINSKLGANQTFTPTSPQRVMSADYVNQQFRYKKYNKYV